ncbi:unnamed protein product [Arabidopsis arenosa]|uniref:Uncharacterized protein n=1 Tax=Arabidopsis arenosa TaxID=38785 RepID=A0A8S2AYK5_ARAAE|nr:unnamed protein product [Arabidopsis arenosa]
MIFPFGPGLLGPDFVEVLFKMSREVPAGWDSLSGVGFLLGELWIVHLFLLLDFAPVKRIGLLFRGGRPLLFFAGATAGEENPGGWLRDATGSARTLLLLAALSNQKLLGGDQPEVEFFPSREASYGMMDIHCPFYYGKR